MSPADTLWAVQQPGPLDVYQRAVLGVVIVGATVVEGDRLVWSGTVAQIAESIGASARKVRSTLTGLRESHGVRVSRAAHGMVVSVDMSAMTDRHEVPISPARGADQSAVIGTRCRSVRHEVPISPRVRAQGSSYPSGTTYPQGEARARVPAREGQSTTPQLGGGADAQQQFKTATRMWGQIIGRMIVPRVDEDRLGRLIGLHGGRVVLDAIEQLGEYARGRSQTPHPTWLDDRCRQIAARAAQPGTAVATAPGDPQHAAAVAELVGAIWPHQPSSPGHADARAADEQSIRALVAADSAAVVRVIAEVTVRLPEPPRRPVGWVRSQRGPAAERVASDERRRERVAREAQAAEQRAAERIRRVAQRTPEDIERGAQLFASAAH